MVENVTGDGEGGVVIRILALVYCADSGLGSHRHRYKSPSEPVDLLQP